MDGVPTTGGTCKLAPTGRATRARADRLRKRSRAANGTGSIERVSFRSMTGVWEDDRMVGPFVWTTDEGSVEVAVRCRACGWEAVDHDVEANQIDNSMAAERSLFELHTCRNSRIP